ncbi:hypothetical protein BH20ACT2_BH20ACT2_09000 [soil metagenome]
MLRHSGAGADLDVSLELGADRELPSPLLSGFTTVVADLFTT